MIPAHAQLQRTPHRALELPLAGDKGSISILIRDNDSRFELFGPRGGDLGRFSGTLLIDVFNGIDKVAPGYLGLRLKDNDKPELVDLVFFHANRRFTVTREDLGLMARVLPAQPKSVTLSFDLPPGINYEQFAAELQRCAAEYAGDQSAKLSQVRVDQQIVASASVLADKLPA